MNVEGERDRIAADYLQRLRRSMRGATPDVVEEGEREIRAHIDDALAMRGDESVRALLDVLDRLGPPEDFGRDLALYMMVEAGYHRWSVPHMVRSTVFWALTTVVGAVVVLLFGLLYALAIAMICAAGLEVLGVATADRFLPWPMPGMPPVGLVLAGVALAGAATALVRWFVGQYVRRARPHTLGGSEAAEEGWVARTSRRILAVAAVGFAVSMLAGLAGGALDPRALATPSIAPDFSASPLATISGLGFALLLLAPVVGVLWTVVAERRVG